MRGRCLCGQVEFEIEGDLSKILSMPLLALSQARGLVFKSAIIVEEGTFRWIAGQEHISSYVRATGFRSDFCARCGSPVRIVGTMVYYGVPAGLLEDGANLEFGAHLFVGSKASWDMIPTTARNMKRCQGCRSLSSSCTPAARLGASFEPDRRRIRPAKHHGDALARRRRVFARQERSERRRAAWLGHEAQLVPERALRGADVVVGDEHRALDIRPRRSGTSARRRAWARANRRRCRRPWRRPAGPPQRGVQSRRASARRR